MIAIQTPDKTVTKALLRELIEDALDAATDLGAAYYIPDADLAYAELNLILATEKLYNAVDTIME